MDASLDDAASSVKIFAPNQPAVSDSSLYDILTDWHLLLTHSSKHSRTLKAKLGFDCTTVAQACSDSFSGVIFELTCRSLICKIHSYSSFEKDLLNKLSFKASAKISNDALLLKTFKFFDLNNAGWVPRSEFFRAIAKAGVVISSPEVALP